MRIPLHGHRYHALSDATLRYIATDAGNAAHAMRHHDPAAECKYLDQVNDAATVLAHRRRAVDKMIQTDRRIGQREATQIHRLLDGRY
jgi:hypothetical protein